MAPGEIPASLLATDRGNASAVIARAQPPTALLSVRLALSFPITSRRSASAGWSWGQVFATRLPTAALRPIEWGQSVVGCRSVLRLGFLLHWLVPPMGVCSPPRIGASHLSPAPHISCSMHCQFVCVVSRACMWKHGSYQRLHGRRFSFLTTGLAGTSRGHVRVLKSGGSVEALSRCVAAME